MVLAAPRRGLEAAKRKIHSPDAGEVLIRVLACGLCRTDLHIVDGELTDPKLPLVPGHEIIGTVERLGEAAGRFKTGDRIGVGWLASTCGKCRYCVADQENLCDYALFTGYTVDGGYAEYAIAREQYCFPAPAGYEPGEAAPLMCAGLIGYRSLVKAGEARRLGMYGFGAAAHIIAQVARHQGREVYAFTRPGDHKAQAFARELGAEWAGDVGQAPPAELDAAIIFAPVGSLVPVALKAVRKGGTVVCGGIHMSDIPRFPYELLWAERTVCSVANVTRQDAEGFLALAQQLPVQTTVQTFPLAEANEALSRVRVGQISGAAVLIP
ncbi:MAG: zinc-dependent alcohol dehydrogenase family protein [Chloroflexi bacterium]|nr:MAG: zinc-dependent alcohol dehydrogenase family protein [Chloroflexota bacterium]